jgi:hypothetical protein
MSANTQFRCPITGKPMRMNSLNGHYQPEQPYSSAENPPGLNERIEAAGYNPQAFMAFDNAVNVLAYMVSEGVRVAAIQPARDRGRFGGWQVVPMVGATETYGGIGATWQPPETYELEWTI